MMLYAILDLLDEGIKIFLHRIREIVGIGNALIGITENWRSTVISRNDDIALSHIEKIKAWNAGFGAVNLGSINLFDISLNLKIGIGAQKTISYGSGGIDINGIRHDGK